MKQQSSPRYKNATTFNRSKRIAIKTERPQTRPQTSNIYVSSPWSSPKELSGRGSNESGFNPIKSLECKPKWLRKCSGDYTSSLATTPVRAWMQNNSSNSQQNRSHFHAQKTQPEGFHGLVPNAGLMSRQARMRSVRHADPERTLKKRRESYYGPEKPQTASIGFRESSFGVSISTFDGAGILPFHKRATKGFTPIRLSARFRQCKGRNPQIKRTESEKMESRYYQHNFIMNAKSAEKKQDPTHFPVCQLLFMSNGKPASIKAKGNPAEDEYCLVQQ